jgi:hypothetical protein
MADYYVRPGARARASTTSDSLLGNDEGKRTTKTYFGSDKSSLFVSMVRMFAETHIERIRRSHAREYGEDITREEAINKYPGCKSWVEAHQQLVDHASSIKGFSSRVAARLQHLDQRDGEDPESSVRGGEEIAD